MTAHPIDTEALRDAVRDHEPDDHGPGKCDLDDCFTSCEECGEDWPCLWSSLPEVLAAAEHRATRAEAQSAIRGRAVVIYRDRARKAEAERDWNIRSSRLAKEERIKANARADEAEARIRDLTQEVRDERAAALDALEQIKAKNKRIQAVQHLIDQADHAGNWTVTCTHLQWAIDG